MVDTLSPNDDATRSAILDGEIALQKLGQRLLNSTAEVAGLKTPDAVLDYLDRVTYPGLDLRLLGVVRFPLKANDWASLALGRSVFLHRDAPIGFWEEWSVKVHHDIPIGYIMARTALSPYSWTESLHALQPIGADRWGFDLALKYGMRDGLMCPIGGRWLCVFWSSRQLSKKVTAAARVMIFAASSFAAMRLQELVGADPGRIGPLARLTPREIAVLRLLSLGKPLAEIASMLKLGEETVRTHSKKAQAKLGAQNRTQAVAEAIRHHLIA